MFFLQNKFISCYGGALTIIFHGNGGILLMKTSALFKLCAAVMVFSFVTACSPVSNYDPSNSVHVAQLETAQTLWAEEGNANGDPYTAGKAAYDIAQLTGEAQWSKRATDFLSEARNQNPQFSLATAYLGSAYALRARDFPLRGLWQVIPGPGFVRMYYVFRAEALLNDAVEQDPQNPITRLIRAATVINMPSIFVSHETALADFALLAEWEQNPNANAAHADVLTSDEWLREFYDNYIETLIEQGEDARAATYKAKRQRL